MTINELMKLTDSIYKPCYEHNNAFVLYAFIPSIKRSMLPRSLQNRLKKNKSFYIQLLEDTQKNFPIASSTPEPERLKDLITEAFEHIRWKAYRADYTVDYFSTAKKRIVYTGGKPEITLSPEFNDLWHFIDTNGQHITNEKGAFARNDEMSPQVIDDEADLEHFKEYIRESLDDYLTGKKKTAIEIGFEKVKDNISSQTKKEIEVIEAAKRELSGLAYFDQSKVYQKLKEEEIFYKALKAPVPIDLSKKGSKTVKAITTVSLLPDDDISLDAAKLTRYDFSVLNAINSLGQYDEKGEFESTFVSTGDIFRQMYGLPSNYTPTIRQEENIKDAIKHMSRISITLETQQDETHPYYPQLEKYEGHVLDVRNVTIRHPNGTRSKGYEILAEPIIHKYSRIINHFATISNDLLAIKEISRSNGALIEGSRVTLTDSALIVRDYLIDRILMIKRSIDKAFSRTILFEDIYEIAFSCGKKRSRKSEQAIRKFTITALDWFKFNKEIADYEIQGKDSKHKYHAIVIKL